jgi:Arc/MetJ-type ribon-helix-helix transcriptional regulator
MTVRLPKDLESSIEALVQHGHFDSVDDAMAEAARMLLCKYEQPLPLPSSDAGLGSIGALSKDAELLDEIVADAYQRRRDDRFRNFDV